MVLEFKILVQATILSLAAVFSVISILKMVTVITKMGMSKILSFNFLGIPILLTIFLSITTSIFYQEIGSFIAKKVEPASSVKAFENRRNEDIRTQSSKYSGSYNGNWEGYLLNQYNSGSAQFSVQSNGRATLTLLGRFSATHQGRIEGKYFITDTGRECSIVELGGGRFKIVLIWTGVNADVYF